MDKLNESATGVATRIDWGALLEQAAQLSLGEITDKGSINQRAVLAQRSEKVDALYAGTDLDRQLASAR